MELNHQLSFTKNVEEEILISDSDNDSNESKDYSDKPEYYRRLRILSISSLSDISISSEDENDTDVNKKKYLSEDEPISDAISKKKSFEEIDLPKIENLSISVKEADAKQIGYVELIIKKEVVVQSFRGVPPINVESVLFLDNGKTALGCIYDVYGQIDEPCYLVRFNNIEEIVEKCVTKGAPVFYAPSTDHTRFVIFDKINFQKGSDASWFDDEEPPTFALEYSDDEQERRAKKSTKKKDKGDDLDQSKKQVTTDCKKRKRAYRAPRSSVSNDLTRRPISQNSFPEHGFRQSHRNAYRTSITRPNANLHTRQLPLSGSQTYCSPVQRERPHQYLPPSAEFGRAPRFDYQTANRQSISQNSPNNSRKSFVLPTSQNLPICEQADQYNLPPRSFETLPIIQHSNTNSRLASPQNDFCDQNRTGIMPMPQNYLGARMELPVQYVPRPVFGGNAMFGCNSSYRPNTFLRNNNDGTNGRPLIMPPNKNYWPTAQGEPLSQNIPSFPPRWNPPFHYTTDNNSSLPTSGIDTSHLSSRPVGMIPQNYLPFTPQQTDQSSFPPSRWRGPPV